MVKKIKVNNNWIENRWKNLNHNESSIKELVDRIFSEAKHQQEVLQGLYSNVLGVSWEQIIYINGFPKTGKEFSDLIWRKSIDFDRKHHPDVIAGGCWMNSGFSTDYELEPWEVDFSSVELTIGLEGEII